MDDSIGRQETIKHLKHRLYETAMNNPDLGGVFSEIADNRVETWITELPTAEPTLRERALMLLLNWAVECDFGYDNFPEQYERYKDEIENMSYIDGMIYIAEKEVERNEKRYGL